MPRNLTYNFSNRFIDGIRHLNHLIDRKIPLLTFLVSYLCQLLAFFWKLLAFKFSNFSLGIVLHNSEKVVGACFEFIPIKI